MSFYDFLYGYKKKYILFSDIKSFFNNKDYNFIHEKVNDFIDKKFLISVKSSPDNGRYPPLKNKFKINIKKDKSILFNYNEKIDISFYKNNFDKFNDDRKVIEIIDGFFNKSGFEYISKRERSFELFNDEKALDDEDVLKVLKRIKVSLEDLYAFRDYEPFSFFKFNDMVKNVLIVENKTPFYDFYKISQEGVKTPFDVVVFGGGNHILKSVDFLDIYFNSDVNYFYWGDIDTRGINIFKGLSKKMDIALWEKAYIFMIEKGKKRKTNKSSQKLKDIDYYFFEKIKEVIKSGFMIPQEAVNYIELKKLIKNNFFE